MAASSSRSSRPLRGRSRSSSPRRSLARYDATGVSHSAYPTQLPVNTRHLPSRHYLRPDGPGQDINAAAGTSRENPINHKNFTTRFCNDDYRAPGNFKAGSACISPSTTLTNAVETTSEQTVLPSSSVSQRFTHLTHPSGVTNSIHSLPPLRPQDLLTTLSQQHLNSEWQGVSLSSGLQLWLNEDTEILVATPGPGFTTTAPTKLKHVQPSSRLYCDGNLYREQR